LQGRKNGKKKERKRLREREEERRERETELEIQILWSKRVKTSKVYGTTVQYDTSKGQRKVYRLVKRFRGGSTGVKDVNWRTVD
jgi:hypothetical protein